MTASSVQGKSFGWWAFRNDTSVDNSQPIRYVNTKSALVKWGSLAMYTHLLFPRALDKSALRWGYPLGYTRWISAVGWTLALCNPASRYWRLGLRKNGSLLETVWTKRRFSPLWSQLTSSGHVIGLSIRKFDYTVKCLIVQCAKIFVTVHCCWQQEWFRGMGPPWLHERTSAFLIRNKPRK